MMRVTVAKVVSLLVSVAVVAGAAHFVMPRAVVEIAGGGPEVEARMGSRFEDMADGTLSALNATEVLEPVAQAEPADVLPVVPAAVLAPAVEQPIAPADVLPTPAVSAPTPLAAAPLPAVPALAVQPAPQAIVAAEPESDAPALSRRPAQKNPELAEKVAKRQEQEQAARAQKRAAEWVTASKAPKGNAQRNNTKGSQSGSNKKAKATQSGKTAKPAAQAGNAAVSNYPGQVMRRISRVGKPRIRTKGTAVISFSVSSGGGLASVSVSRSSGSAALDRAAVGMIRKAAPFPRPPAGAQRRFTIRIKGQ